MVATRTLKVLATMMEVLMAVTTPFSLSVGAK
jgi:hypothetical protein